MLDTLELVASDQGLQYVSIRFYKGLLVMAGAEPQSEALGRGQLNGLYLAELATAAPLEGKRGDLWIWRRSNGCMHHKLFKPFGYVVSAEV